LNTTSAGNLQIALLKALPGMTAAQFKTLSEILSPLAAATSVPKHCVRCHESFYENENNPKACAIRHNDDADGGERDDYDVDVVYLTLTCCDMEFELDEGEPEGFCYETTHTANPDEVEYYDEFDGEGNKHVVTCKQKGCLRKKRKTSQGVGRPAKKKKVSCLDFYAFRIRVD
jgi:hypothetical protein